jgi:hypothetical protein
MNPMEPRFGNSSATRLDPVASGAHQTLTASLLTTFQGVRFCSDLITRVKVGFTCSRRWPSANRILIPDQQTWQRKKNSHKNNQHNQSTAWRSFVNPSKGFEGNQQS